MPIVIKTVVETVELLAYTLRQAGIKTVPACTSGYRYDLRVVVSFKRAQGYKHTNSDS